MGWERNKGWGNIKKGEAKEENEEDEDEEDDEDEELKSFVNLKSGKCWMGKYKERRGKRRKWRG